MWCENEQASPQSHYETDCNGAISFFARGVTKHVTGEVSEPEEGQYVMALVSDDGSVACMASNVPPIKGGPHNTVTADCTVNGASVTGLVIPNAVVNATGP